MKIGVLDPYLDTLGGGEKYMLTAASCLSKYHCVSLFWPPQEEKSIKKRVLDRFGIDLSSVEFTENIFSKKTSFIERILKAKKYDAIFYLSDGSLPLLFIKKFIIHFQFPVNWVNGGNVSTKAKFLLIHKIVCNSYFTKKYIDKTYSVNSLVLYPPTDDPVGAIHNKGNIILTVGRFNFLPEGGDFKKLNFMINVFKTMIDKGLKNWEFVVVVSFKQGDGENVNNLVEIAKGYPVKIERNITHEKLNDFYKKVKIYWHAAGFGEDIVKHPERAEHFGIATVEAMKNGAVPVAINFGGQPEIIDDGINGFLWRTRDELIQKTLVLIKNPKILENISEKSREISKKFSQEKFCQEILEIFK